LNLKKPATEPGRLGPISWYSAKHKLQNHAPTAMKKTKCKKKTKSKPDPVERFLALSEAEKAAELAPFERGEVPRSRSRPLTPAERKMWNKIQKSLQRGRPTVGAGAKVMSISIERGLLKKADAFAKRHHLKRSQMVAEGLRLVMQRRAG